VQKTERGGAKSEGGRVVLTEIEVGLCEVRGRVVYRKRREVERKWRDVGWCTERGRAVYGKRRVVGQCTENGDVWRQCKFRPTVGLLPTVKFHYHDY
jgi:hypothetical protein